MIDRCNGKTADRRLILACSSATFPIAIFFDLETAYCTLRAQQTAGHPSLRPGRGVERAIEQHAREQEAPMLEEGFKAVVRVTSNEASRSLIELLCPLLPFNFPRTHHIYDLGAATKDECVTQVSPPLS